MQLRTDCQHQQCCIHYVSYVKRPQRLTRSREVKTDRWQSSTRAVAFKSPFTDIYLPSGYSM